MLKLRRKLGRLGAVTLLVLQACVLTSLALSCASVAIAQPAQPPGQSPSPSQPAGGEKVDKVDINVDIGSHSDAVWYTQWWAWGIGVAVFLVVVIALTNRGQTA